MARYTVVNMGIYTAHEKEFAHRLPHGFPFWVFLHVLTPHIINIGPEMRRVQPGTCIIYPPNAPRYLYCPDDLNEIRNNWLHFSGDDVSDMLSHCGIPLNQPFMLKQAMPIETTLQELNYEFSQVSAFREEMASVLVDMLLLQLGRDIIPDGDDEKSSAMQHYQPFEQLRKQLYARPQEQWTVAAMAKDVFLGQNRFIDLYKRFFDVTPRQDVINARIQKARSLLDSHVTLREVAINCGFQNEYYFSTVFKREVGITPGQFRDEKYRFAPLMPLRAQKSTTVNGSR